MLTLQNGRSVRPELKRTMVFPVSGEAPEMGVIDLKGPPW